MKTTDIQREVIDLRHGVDYELTTVEIPREEIKDIEIGLFGVETWVHQLKVADRVFETVRDGKSWMWIDMQTWARVEVIS